MKIPGSAILLLLAGLWPLAGYSAEPVRLMALGDSITQGAVGRPGYLPGLLQRLQEKGCKVESVGSMRGEFGATSGSSTLVHEGHWGWLADQVLAQLDGWAKSARPDLALIHLGTNDLGNGESVESTLAELAQIVATLRRANPRMVILLGQIIPTNHTPLNRVIEKYNRGVGLMAAQLNRPDSPVVAVDHYSGFDAGAHNYDGIHPNPVGATLMATRWMEALERLNWLDVAACRGKS